MQMRILNPTLLIYLVLLMWLPARGYGQSSTRETWTLEEVLQVARENNWEIKKSEQEILSRQAEFRSTLATFLPGIGVSQSVTHTNDPLAVFGIKLQQEIVTQNDFATDLLNNPASITDFNLGITVEQPLINPDALAGRRAASFTLDASRQQNAHLKHHVKYLVKQSYYAIQLAHERQRVLEEAHNNALENHRIANNNLEEGTVSRADVMSARVRVLDIESKIAVAKDQVVSAGQMLAFLLGRDLKAQIIPAEQLTMVRPATNDKEYNLEVRSDIMALKSGVMAREKMVDMQKLKFIPRLNAFGAYNFHSDELTAFDAQSWVVGATLQWKIFSGNKNLAGISQARANAQLARLNQQEYMSRSQMEVDRARRQIGVAETALIAVEMAEQETAESFRIRRDRYKEGIERTSDLLASEMIYSEKQLERLNAIYNYNNAVFYLEYLMESE